MSSNHSFKNKVPNELFANNLVNKRKLIHMPYNSCAKLHLFIEVRLP